MQHKPLHAHSSETRIPKIWVHPAIGTRIARQISADFNPHLRFSFVDTEEAYLSGGAAPQNHLPRPDTNCEKRAAAAGEANVWPWRRRGRNLVALHLWALSLLGRRHEVGLPTHGPNRSLNWSTQKKKNLTGATTTNCFSKEKGW
jgi:hypothetical protein